jgi:sugar phosphate isomerase/epimerase
MFQAERLHVHVPFRLLLGKYLPFVLKHRLNPEISFDFQSLAEFSQEEFKLVAEELLTHGLSVTFHAPFMDLRPGAVDPQIRTVSLRRIEEVLSLAPLFRPRGVICHPSFDRRYYVSTEELWLKYSIETWEYLAHKAENLGTVIVLENVYEHVPSVLTRIFHRIPSPALKFCFDTGHYNVFSEAPLEEWIQELGAFLCEVHLHDNGGKLDEHKCIGAGTFPFEGFFALLRKGGLRPILTLETHREEDLWPSISALERWCL